MPAVDVYAGHVDAIVRWWDGVELWVTGLPFILQVIVVMVVLVPLATLVAVGLDIVVSKGFALFGRGDDDTGPAPTVERGGADDGGADDGGAVEDGAVEGGAGEGGVDHGSADHGSADRGHAEHHGYHGDVRPRAAHTGESED